MSKRECLIHITVTKDVKERLKRIADKQGRTVVEIIREGIAEMFKRYECFEGVDDAEKINN